MGAKRGARVEIIVDLPMPPSANRIWRYGKGQTYLSPEYTYWKRAADAHVMAQSPAGGFPYFDGPFAFEIVLDREATGRGDPDNKIKPLLDYAQRVAFIKNDRWLRRLTLEFGEAPEGCRLTIRAVAA